jgi:hypothetical protein
MASLGVADVDALEELGRGTYAVAYRLPDGRVLKVTADSRSARAAKVVLEAGPAPGIVHVYEVKQLPGGTPFWATVEEYVLDAEHLHDDVRNDLDAAVEAVQWLLDREWLSKLKAAGASRDAAERIIRQFASAPPLWENEAQAVRWLMDIATGLSWLRDHGVRGMSDFHEHNVGIRENGSAVIFDLSSDRIRSSGAIDVAANPARKPFDVRKVFVALGRPREVPSMEALAKGIEVEMEHTDDPVLAGKIALDHFREFPDYYERLEVMEERAKKGLPPNARRQPGCVAQRQQHGGRPWTCRVCGKTACDICGLHYWSGKDFERRLATCSGACRRKVDEEFRAKIRAGRLEENPNYSVRPGTVLTLRRLTTTESRGSAERETTRTVKRIVLEEQGVFAVRFAEGPERVFRVDLEAMEVTSARPPLRYEILDVRDEGALPNPKLVNNGSKMPRVAAAFDRCFEIVRVQFPDFGEIELHQDEKAASDNGHGSERQFGYCMDGDPIRIAFARKTEDLPEVNINGLVAHEFGHALDNRYGDGLSALLDCDLPRGAERRADAIAKEVFGKTIKYDTRDVQCVACRGEAPRPRRLGA